MVKKQMPANRWIYQWSLKISLFLSIILSIHLEPAKSQQSVKKPRGNENDLLNVSVAGSPNLPPLESISGYQKELSRECRRLELERLRELEFLINFEAQNGQVQFPRPIKMKLPAVCLFLMQQQASNWETNPPEQAHRLELVNWVYLEHEEELRDRAKSRVQAHRMSKRHLESASDQLISEYLFNSSYADEEPSVVTWENQIESELGDTRGHRNLSQELRTNVDHLIADSRYKKAVEANKKWLSKQLSPVILIPGLLGSRLQAQIDKKHRVNILCRKNTKNWQDMWLSVKSFLPFLVDCWLDNARLEFDPSSGFTKNPQGVRVRVPLFGSVESVRAMDPNSVGVSKYFSQIIDHYEQLGYTPDENLLAAPYDFRLAPQQLDGYFSKLKQLIEASRSHTGSNIKVTLLCHSMGCTNLYIFLRNQSASWRKENIRKMIAISSPWAGSFKALKALIVGDQLDLPLVSESKMRTLARTFPSIAFLLPQADLLHQYDPSSANVSLVETPQRSYTVNQMADLLRDLNLTRSLDWFERSSALLRPIEPLLDLRIECVHSLNTPTMESIVLKDERDPWNGPYELKYGQGDGTVNGNSLLVCETWARKLPELVRHTVIWNTNHVGVLSHKKTLQFLTDDVMLATKNLPKS